jgi:hypothetical protein
LPEWRGFFGSYRITEKNSVATISAAEQQLVGWPVPDSDVDRTLSIRSAAALFFNKVISAAFAEAMPSSFQIMNR